jgi:hypothetical protein
MKTTRFHIRLTAAAFGVAVLLTSQLGFAADKQLLNHGDAWNSFSADAYTNSEAARERSVRRVGKHATDVELPPAPQASEEVLRASNDASSANDSRFQQKANQSSLTRSQVVNLYNTLYVPGNTATVGWTGAVPPTCMPGTTNATYRQATLDRINFYRQIAGLPTITFFLTSDTTGLNAQASALMQGANLWNGPNPHSPPNTWKCYSSGAASAAGSSNLAKGGAGPGAIDLYMDDFGRGNLEVGHRRWLLYPPFIKSFSGDVPSSGSSPDNITPANDLVVFGAGTHGSRPPMPNGVAWPPGGFVPYQVLPDVSNRWSFSWPGANMTAATARVTKNGQPVAILGYDSRDNLGYGDASIVFRPNNVSANGPFVSYANPGAGDQDYIVVISGMSGSSVPSSVTYTVTVIDPAAVAPVSVSGAASLSAGGNVPDGTTLCADQPAGVTCTPVTSGSFSCTVPSGWTGTLHLQAGNAKRVAAKRFTTGVTTAQTNQNFVVADANNATLTCNLDIDNNGLNEAAIDGAMILRNLFGVVGTEQAISTSGVCAQRVSLADKATFLNAQDFDGSSANDERALRLGLVITRLMLGITGTQAVAGTGLTWSSVQTQLNNNCGTSFN